MAYSPAGTTTGSASLAHLAAVYYKRKGLDRLQKKFVFRDACMDDQLPKQVGKTVQWFRYTNLAANTTPVAEGTAVSSATGPQILTTKVVTATVSQYTSYMTLSDMVKDTAIDSMVTNAAEILGYQGGFTVDNITRGIIDAASGSSAALTLQGSYAKVADLRNAKSQLSAFDVEPFEGGEFLAIAHPFVTYDIVNDPSAGGLADIFKYTDPRSTALVRYEDRGTVAHVAGCKLIESTNVFFSASPNKYRMYVFGKGGVGAVDLEGRGPNKVQDPKRQRFNVNVIPGGKSIADPEGVIGAALSYNFVYTAVILEGPAGIGGAYRFRMFDCPSSVG